MSNLRDYQLSLLSSILGEWQQQRKRVLLQLPTGTGKTRIFVEPCQTFLNQGLRTLVLVHREELVDQAVARLQQRYPQQSVGVIARGQTRNQNALLVVASVKTLVNRELPNAALVIIDEAHHAYSRSFARLIEQYDGAYFLGVTATPRRTDKKGLDVLSGGVRGFESLIKGGSADWYIQHGYLSPFQVKQKGICLDLSGVRHSSNGDFDRKELGEVVSQQLEPSQVIQEWERDASDRQTVVYNVNVDYSRLLTEAFQQHGYSAAHLDGTTPKSDRKEIIEGFRRGEIQILSQVEIVVEGVDVPDIDCILFLRPTECIVILHQAIGRGLRKSENSQFEDCLVLDFTGTTDKLPLPDCEFPWSLEKWETPASALVQCPECESSFLPTPNELEIGVADCPVCQHQFLLRADKVPQKKGRKKPSIETVIPPDWHFELFGVDGIEPKKAKFVHYWNYYCQQKGWDVKKVKYEFFDTFEFVSYMDLQLLQYICDHKSGWVYHSMRELREEGRFVKK